MSRFRYDGVNWEGRKWSASAAIKQLGMQISEAYPTPHGTDGTVASKPHDMTSPSSDHRPKPTTGFGRVRGIDIGNPNPQTIEAIRLSRDPRLKYMIFNGKICSSYDHSDGPPYSWRTYSGSNKHETHAHLSVLASADADARPWNIGEGGEDMPLSAADLAAIKLVVKETINEELQDIEIPGEPNRKAFQTMVNSALHAKVGGKKVMDLISEIREHLS